MIYIFCKIKGNSSVPTHELSLYQPLCECETAVDHVHVMSSKPSIQHAQI